MREKILQNVEALKLDMVNSIVSSIKIPSIIDDATSNCPFGKNIDMALDNALELCKKLGFKTYKDKDGYYGYAEIGEGSELVGVLGHLDIVPIGNIEAWDYKPFDGTIVDGKIIGRGAIDDKGPMIASVYALKAVINAGAKLNKRVRFIFGTDEENLWRDIAKYKENKEELPNLGFTPDASFPCINAEKGLLQCVISSKTPSSVKLKAGEVFNAVPSNALYSGAKNEEIIKELEKLGFEFQKTEDGIKVIGKSAHSKDCYKGINPIVRLAEVFKNIGIESNAINFMYDILRNGACGEKIIADCKDDVSGPLTVNLGKIELDESGEKLFIDIRMPVTFDKDKIVNALIEKCKGYNFEYEEYDWQPSLYMPADHFLIKTLMKVYTEETGFDGTPLSSGGATYARSIDNCVAFGAVFPGGAKTEHQPNEFVDINDLVKATNIYALSLYELTK